MFTGGALVLVAVLLFVAHRGNQSDRRMYDLDRDNSDAVRHLMLHIRQDMKMLVFLLAGVIVMLGIVADQMH
jgi:hypothetical protein